jgi:hypothetical protein
MTVIIGNKDRTSSPTPGPINQDVPGHGDFITVDSSPFDWRNPKNDNLWKEDGTGINNPCPPGWRVPTWYELDAERLSWAENNRSGAYASTLKWPVAGYRNNDGDLSDENFNGRVWSSSVGGVTDPNNAFALIFFSNNAGVTSGNVVRAQSYSVRCVRGN